MTWESDKPLKLKNKHRPRSLMVQKPHSTITVHVQNGDSAPAPESVSRKHQSWTGGSDIANTLSADTLTSSRLSALPWVDIADDCPNVNNYRQNRKSLSGTLNDIAPLNGNDRRGSSSSNRRRSAPFVRSSQDPAIPISPIALFAHNGGLQTIIEVAGSQPVSKQQQQAPQQPDHSKLLKRLLNSSRNDDSLEEDKENDDVEEISINDYAKDWSAQRQYQSLLASQEAIAATNHPSSFLLSSTAVRDFPIQIPVYLEPPIRSAARRPTSMMNLSSGPLHLHEFKSTTTATATPDYQSTAIQQRPLLQFNSINHAVSPGGCTTAKSASTTSNVSQEPLLIELDSLVVSPFDLLYRVIKHPRFTEDGHRGLWGWSLVEMEIFAGPNVRYRVRRVLNVEDDYSSNDSNYSNDDDRLTADDLRRWSDGLRGDGGSVLVLRRRYTEQMDCRRIYHHSVTSIDIDGLLELVNY